MSYQVLARKWRPRSFSTLVGQDHVVRALTHALGAGRLHHAYLFTGTRGVGKTTLARILAKALNCEQGMTANPCGQCGSCQEIDAGRFVDLLEVDAATNTRVDEMRQLLENAVYAPTRGRYKVYVIDEVHMLSNSAFNAMLKTLEEPPEHVKFILATTDPQKIPVTVLSRCLQFNLKQMSEPAIAAHLAHILGAEGVSYDKAALGLISRAASGSMRDALSVLDQAIAHGAGQVEEAQVRSMLGVVAGDHVLALLEGVLAGDAAELWRLASEMSARSISLPGMLSDMASMLVRIQLVQSVPSALDEDEPDVARIAALARQLAPEFVQLCYQIVIHGRQELPFAPDEFAGFLMTLLRLHAFRPATVPEIAAHAAELSRPVRPERLVTRVAAAPVHDPVQPATQVQATVAPAPSPVLAESAAPQHAPAAGSEGADWRDILLALSLGGMARELAQHCELRSLADGVCNLRLPPAMGHLQMKPAVDKLQSALNDYMGSPVVLRIELASVAGETPALAATRERRERQDDAVAAIEQDPFVRDMVDMFDANIIQSTIKPIN